MRWDSPGAVGHLVPNERFFVRNRTRTPLIDRAAYRLRVDGPGVRRPLRLSLRELERLPSRSTDVAIECSLSSPGEAA